MRRASRGGGGCGEGGAGEEHFVCAPGRFPIAMVSLDRLRCRAHAAPSGAHASLDAVASM